MSGTQSNNTDKYEIRNPSTRREERRAPTSWCSNCKEEGHSGDGCWFLYPYLRPKRKGNTWGENRQREKSHNDDTKKGGEQVGCRTHLATGPKRMVESRKETLSQPSSNQDLMWQLYKELHVLLQQNSHNNSSITVNLSLNSSKIKWVLDFRATDHMTGIKSY
jgi:hypothetical protein